MPRAGYPATTVEEHLAAVPADQGSALRRDADQRMAEVDARLDSR